MKPLRLRARNLRTFPELDITFGEGLVGILGELRDAPAGADSNGAGKSTILEALDIALFGRRSLAGYLTRGGDVDELTVELTFQHADSLYRIRRTYSAKGRGKTSVDLEICHDTPIHSGDDHGPGWEPLTRASAKETDAVLCDLLGLSRETFRDSAYLRQGDGGYADPDRDPRQRKELLVEAVLGRDPVWPRLAETAKNRRKLCQQRLERCKGEIETLQQLAGDVAAAEYEAKQADVAVTEAASAVGEAERQLEAAAARYQQARDQAGKRETLQAELTAARDTLDALQRRDVAATEAVTAIETAREEIDALTTSSQLEELLGREQMLLALSDSYREALVERDAAADATRAATLRRNDLLGRANELNERAHALREKAEQTLSLDEHDRSCDRCGQTLGAEAAERAAASYRAEATGLDTEAARLDAQAKAIEIPTVPTHPAPPVVDGDTVANHLNRIRNRIAVARNEQAERARLEERIVQLQRDADRRPAPDEIQAALAHVRMKQLALDRLEPVGIAVLECAGHAARVELDGRQAEHQALIGRKARCDERLAQAQAAEAKLADRARETTQLQADVDRDLLLERCYGRDGIPALIIENSAIPYLETEASRILQLLGTSFQVELRTQAENKTGGLRDTLQVVVIDQDGNEADYADGCSGGEQTRVGLALRIALARLLAHRRGAKSRLLALDEPSYLDQAGMAALLDVLRGLESDFDLVLLVSHVPELRDALDNVIVVVKENGCSRVEGAPVPVEAVAA